MATTALRLDGGSVIGGAINNDGVTTGHGEITADAFGNKGTFASSGDNTIDSELGDRYGNRVRHDRHQRDGHARRDAGYRPGELAPPPGRATVGSGDCSGDGSVGSVGSADLDIVRANWGNSAAAAEPSTVLLGVLLRLAA